MSSLPRVSRERMVDQAPGQINKPESKGFVAMVFGLNYMDVAKKKVAEKTSLTSNGQVKSRGGNI
jgi:hypothetical protein